MGSTAMTTDGHVKKVYDLKGSLVKRYNKGDETKVTQREKEAKFKTSSALKDVNFLKMRKEENFVRFTKKDAEDIMRRISIDISLLREFSLMDYSLLVIVEHNPNYVEKYQDQYRT